MWWYGGCDDDGDGDGDGGVGGCVMVMVVVMFGGSDGGQKSYMKRNRDVQVGRAHED